MQLTRVLVALCLLSLATSTVARADDSTPLPAPTNPPVIVQPTSPPSVDTPVPVSTPAPDNSPVPVAPETHPTVRVDEPLAQPPTAAPGPAPGDRVPSPANPSAPVISVPPQSAPPSRAPPPPAISSGNSPDVATGQTPDWSIPSLVDGTSGTSSASAPAELSCHGKQKPNADPFMVAPYRGWSDVNSFLDHDSPDYGVDGTIVIANGLTATSSDGESSDFFPAYWSSALRQYVNYDGHNGYDFGISYQPVLAAGAGKVEFAGWTDGGYGDMILIDHRNGYVTLYGHLSKLEVKQGDAVEAGQEIGISGSTGNSSGPHLHFSVFHNCQVTDPYGWTGRGADPLTDFDGERATYLWMPGEDPLILNPPPNWPSFPLGLKVPYQRIPRLGRGARRTVPPADRLLLLRLPASHADGGVSSTVALARTEALVTQEAEALTPYLQDLQAQGLIQSYQVIPAAAAVWERGTATAAQLESLPGVASLAGGQPRDLDSAQVGLAHSVLMQIGRGQAPSLWPVGFRSALNTWRPTVAVAIGHALVTGFAWPGEAVRVVLHRGNSVPGASAARTEPESGGFVATIHDRAGVPVNARPGDVVEAQSGGRTTRVRVLPFTLQARASHITGTSQRGATIPIVLLPAGGKMSKAVSAEDSSGSFKASTPRMLPAGTLAVATVTDAAGNQESATAFVPGIVVDQGSSTVHGWTVGDSPHLQVLRHGRRIFRQNLAPAPDGSFQIELTAGQHGIHLRSGDVLTVGSRWHPRRFSLPDLSLTLPSGASNVLIHGPSNGLIHVSCRRSDGRAWIRPVRLNESGRGVMRWPGGSISMGDTATVQAVTSSGDAVQFSQEARGIVIQLGASTVSGRVRPGVTLRIHALSRSGRPLGGAVATSDPVTGSFSARLGAPSGATLRIEPPMRVELQDTTGTIVVSVPSLSIRAVRAGLRVSARVAPNTAALATLFDRRNHRSVRHLTADATGHIAADFARKAPSQPIQKFVLVIPLSQGLSVERVLVMSHRSASRPPLRHPPAKRTLRRPGR